MGNGLANQVSNPHVEVDITKPDVMIRRQIAVLKEMTTWLKAAHSGNDITYDSGRNHHVLTTHTGLYITAVYITSFLGHCLSLLVHVPILVF